VSAAVHLDRSADALYLDSERLALQAQARAFACDHLLPLARELDAEQRDIPEETVDAMAALGYFGIMVDRDHGGLGLGAFEYCLISEELARAWMSSASIIARSNGTGTNVPDPQRQDDLLRRSAAGRWVAGVALSEPEAGSDLAAASCRAIRSGDTWTFHGSKRWCGWAVRADFILLLARTGPDRHKGLEWFVIEKPRGELPEGMTGTPIPKIGYFGITSYALELDGVTTSEANRIRGDEVDGGIGFYDSMRLLNVARVHTAARAVGVARGALEDALAYARHRRQFGRPIADFQAIRFKLADMATDIAAARHLYYHAADVLDRGIAANELCAMSKLHATEMAERVTSEAVQILGGNGYTTEFDVQRHWRDARLTKIFEGTSEIQRLIISRGLVREAV
jgi:alkylation response protein AidB-like acyl-CoA dehydrogenase